VASLSALIFRLTKMENKEQQKKEKELKKLLRHNHDKIEDEFVESLSKLMGRKNCPIAELELRILFRDKIGDI
jgi:hypothetical protein